MKKIIFILTILSLTSLFAQSQQEAKKKSILLKLNSIEKCFLLSRNNKEYSICQNKLIGLTKTLNVRKVELNPQFKY